MNPCWTQVTLGILGLSKTFNFHLGVQGYHNLQGNLGTIKLGLNNMRKSFFETKNTMNIVMTKQHIFIDFLIVQASYREAGPLTRRLGLTQGGRASPLGRPGLSQGGRASHRDARPLTGRLGLSQGSQRGRASHQGRPDLLQRGRASHKEASQLKGRPGLSQKARPLLWRPCLSQGGQASHKKAGPLTRRPALSQGGQASLRVLHTLPKIQEKT